MALANVAYQLAVKRQNVFVIDFDLEAPGLSFMPDFRPRGKAPKSPIGLAGFLEAGINDKPVPQVKDLSYVPKIAGGKEVPGRIHVLPSGDLARGGRAYDVSDLHLEQLYADKRRAVVIDDLREQIAGEFKPDYLLVDSRTGLTEIAGICTTHLAEFVVILFGLNQQNLEGTALVLQRLRKARSKIAGRCLLVASPVPNGEEQLKGKRIKAARSALAAALQVEPAALPDILTIPYHPQLALSEESFVACHPDTYLASAYRTIAFALRERNPKDLGFKFEQAVAMLPDSVPRAMELLKEACRPSDAPAKALSLYGALLDGTGNAGEAEPYFRRAVDAAPKDESILGGFAVFLEQRKRLEEAEVYYRKAIDADPKHANNLGNYATFLADRERSGEAEEYFRKAIEADPKHANNLGNYALFLKQRERNEEAEEYYRKAIEADPKHASTLSGLASLLAHLGRSDEAEELHQRAIRTDPQSARALGAYGWFLYNTRGDLDGGLKRTEQTLELDPESATASLNRGLFLLLLGRHDEARRQYEGVLSKVDEGVLREGLDDLRGAAAKRPDDKAVAEMIRLLEARLNR